jgi:hypothetical protein
VERHGHALPGRANYLSRHGAVELGVGSRLEVLLLAQIFQLPTRFKFRQSCCSRSYVGGDEVLAESGRRRFAVGRGSLSGGTGGNFL